MDLIHIMNIPIWVAVTIVLYLIGILILSIRYAKPVIRWAAVVSYVVFAAAYRIDIAIPVGLGVAIVFLLITMVKEAFKKSKEHFTVATLLGILCGFFVWVVFFH